MLVQDRCTCGGAPGISARPRSGAVMPLMSRPVNLTVHRRRPVLVTVAVLIALLVGYAAVAVTRASAVSPLLSQGKPAIASSVENAGLPASAAVDGNTGTRWSSAFSDPQWLRVDLGATATIDQVVLAWETAYATAFQIQVSPDASAWTTIASTTTGTGGTQTLTVNGTVVPPTPTPSATGSDPEPDVFWGDTSTIPAAKKRPDPQGPQPLQRQVPGQPGVLELRRAGALHRRAAVLRHAGQQCRPDVLLPRRTEQPVLRLHRVHRRPFGVQRNDEGRRGLCAPTGGRTR